MSRFRTTTIACTTTCHFALICSQWQWRHKQAYIIHHKVITQVSSCKVVNRHTCLSIALIRLDRKYHLLPTRSFQQLSYKIHAYILPWGIIIVPSLHIATENRVTLAIPPRRSWVTEPCRTSQCLSRTNHSIRIDTSHQTRFHRTIHIQRLAAMRTLTCPIFVYTVCHSVLSIEWEQSLTSSAFILRCQITRRIHITVTRFSPRQVITLTIETNSSQRLITTLYALLRNQSCRRRTVSIHTHILHLKLRNTQFRCIPRSTCWQCQRIYLLIRSRWSIRANNQIIHLCSITWTANLPSILFPHNWC